MEMTAPGIWKLTLGTPEEFTPVKVIKPLPATVEIIKLPNVNNPPFEAGEIHARLTKRGYIVEIPLKASEKLYGFGLQLKSFNQEGKKKHLRTNADPVADTGDTHAPVPFYVSTEGYGILVDTFRYATFYCGSNSKLAARVSAEKTKDRVIADNTNDLYRNRGLMENRSMVIEVPNADGVDIYIFAGPDLKTAVQRYNLFSGGGCLPPLWSLGVWYRTYSRANAEQVMRIAEDFRQNHIPCDVLGLEPGWQSHAYSCSFKWDHDRFPEPEKFIKNIRQMNYHVNLWEHVFVHPTSPIYNSLKEYSGDYEVWEGLVPDLSIEKARNIFEGYHRDELALKGISGFKLDECDSSDYTGGWSFPNCAFFPSGMDGEQMHSAMGLLYQISIYNVYLSLNRRTYGDVRSSHAFASSLPFVLYSDLYNHRDYIRGLVNAGFSGLLWSPEVRNASSGEDLIRRLQLSVFSPQTVVNAWFLVHPPWKQYNRQKNQKGELIENYQNLQDQCRRILELRMKFIPYIYSSFARYCFEGIPPFRALVMDYPQDANTHKVDDEYMMGDSVLVAPVISGESCRTVYLPEGNWFCFWTNKKYSGSKEYTVDVPLENIPLYIKEGSLLPLAEPLEFITKDTCFDITVVRYGDKSKSFILFEDDGFTFDFVNDKFNKIHIKWNGSEEPEVSRTGNYSGNCRYNIVGWKKVL